MSLSERIRRNEERLNGIEAHIKSQTTGKIIKQLKNEINEVTKLRKVEQKMSKKGEIERFEMTKLLMTSIIIPLLQALTIIISNYWNYGEWSWNPVLIAINVISIPTIMNWLYKKFNKKELAKEKETSDLKVKHMEQLIVKNDEINALKIKAELAMVKGINQV